LKTLVASLRLLAQATPPLEARAVFPGRSSARVTARWKKPAATACACVLSSRLTVCPSENGRTAATISCCALSENIVFESSRGSFQRLATALVRISAAIFRLTDVIVEAGGYSEADSSKLSRPRGNWATHEPVKQLIDRFGWKFPHAKNRCLGQPGCLVRRLQRCAIRSTNCRCQERRSSPRSAQHL